MNEHVTKSLAIGVLLLNAPAVGADWYESESEFLAVVASNFYHETFDDFEWGYPHDGSQLSWDAPGANGFGWTASAPQGLFSSPGAMSTDWVHDTLTVTFTGLDVTAVGGNFAGVDWFGDVIPSSVTVTLSNGEVQVLENPTGSSFLGWTSSEPIVSIAVSAEGELENAWPVIDSFYVGQIDDGNGDAQFIPLDGVPCGAFGLSGDGSTGVGWAGLPVFNGVRWNASGDMFELNVEGLPQSIAYNASEDGAVIVGTGHFNSGQQAVLWAADGSRIDLGLLPSGTASHAFAVSGDGTIVVGRGEVEGKVIDQAFRWTAEDGMLPLMPNRSEARGISADGTVIAGIMHPIDDPGANALRQAFRWTEEDGPVALGFLDGYPTYANAVSGDGTTVVGASAVIHQAFRWTADDGMVGLGALPDHDLSVSSAVSGDGSTVVGHSTGDDGARAFIWTAQDGMQNLQDVLIAHGATGLDDWVLTQCYAVSSDGLTFAGSAANPDGVIQGWIATLPPAATPGDLNGDGVVDVSDLLILLAAWGPCADCNDCPADLNDDCAVDVSDLLILLANWG